MRWIYAATWKTWLRSYGPARDIKEFQTLPKYTLRRLTVTEMNGSVSGGVGTLRRFLGEDYLSVLKSESKIFAAKSSLLLRISRIMLNRLQKVKLEGKNR